jgi:DNA invertase Pin-like site-specific DNA recombinase
MSNPKRCAIYARVSTSDQDPTMQLDELRAYAERRGWSIVGEFVDKGESGAKDRRPQLDDLMARLRRGGVDVVAVWKFSRFARSVRHLVTALDEFKALGVDFVSISEGIDTTTPIGKMTFTIIAAIDEFFLDTLKENTKAGLAAARRRGRRLGRVPADRRLPGTHKGKRLDVDRARELIAEGASVRAAARELEASEATLRRALARCVKDVFGNESRLKPDCRGLRTQRSRSVDGRF